MANNCLLTRLKGIATNDSLPKLDSFEIKSMTATDSVFKVTIKSSSNVKIKARGNGYLADTIAELSINPKAEVSGTDFTCFLPATEFTFDVFNKFAITEFFFEKRNMSDARGGDGVKQNCVNIADLAMSPITNYQIYIGGIQAENPSIANLPMSNTKRFFLQQSNIGSVGNSDIAQFAASPMAALYLSNYITGKIEDLVAAWVNNTYGLATARTSGSNVTLSPSNTLQNITFYGNVINGNALGSNGSLNWNGTSYISVVGASKVFAKGATADQISAWEGAGKTVVVIS